MRLEETISVMMRIKYEAGIIHQKHYGPKCLAGGEGKKAVAANIIPFSFISVEKLLNCALETNGIVQEETR